MFNWFKKFTEDYEVEQEDETLLGRIIELETRVLKLEVENVELTNTLYEVENRLQSKVDNIHPSSYNLGNYTLDK